MMRYAIWIVCYMSFACAMKRNAPENFVPMGKIDQGLFLLAFSKSDKSVKEYQQWLIEQDNAVPIEITNIIPRPLIITGLAGQIFDKVDRQYYYKKTLYSAYASFNFPIDNCTEGTAYIENGVLQDTVSCNSIFNDFDTIKEILNKIELYTKNQE